jgi:hypothetical protein
MVEAVLLLESVFLDMIYSFYSIIQWLSLKYWCNKMLICHPVELNYFKSAHDMKHLILIHILRDFITF